MSTTSPVGFRSGGVMNAANVRFDGTGALGGQVTANGQLLIGNAVFPNIRVGTLTSPSGTLTIGYAAPNITIDLAGGSVGIDSIAVQAVTAPGVSPVLPTGAGLVTFNGAAVAAQTIPVQSRSIALNSYQLEVQRASSSAGTNATQQGLASFNSAHFSVDGSGWVSSLNGLPASAFDVQANTAPGTDPVVPSALGVVQVNGTIVPAQLIPIRTNSLAANAYNIETQYASAQAVDTAAASGMAHFDSSQFAVSATGFVQSLASVAFVWQDSAPVAMANYNGYFATGAGAYTLPAGVADGDTVEIIDQIGGGVVVTAQGGDTIRMGNIDSSVNGTATTTQMSDGARFIFRATGQYWISQPAQTGNWILA